MTEFKKRSNGAAAPAGLDLAKTVLITGGAGFIGQRLVHRLLDEDLTTHLVILDSGVTGDLPSLTKALDARPRLVLAKQEEKPRTMIIQGDVRDVSMYQAMIQAMVAAKFPPLREVYHLACPASPIAYEKIPVETLLTAVLGTAQVLTFCDKVAVNIWKDLPPPRIVHASTSEVYGDYFTPDAIDLQRQPIPVDYRGSVSFTGPRACYDEGKRAAEALVHDTMRVSKVGLDVRVARLFNAYGPGMKPSDGRVVSAFICAALTNEPLTVFGDGKQTRSLTYVDDTVEGLRQLMDLPKNPGPINLGDPAGEIEMERLAWRILDLVSATKSEILTGPAREDEPRFRVPDVSKTRKELPNWQCKTDLEEGLRKTVSYLSEKLVELNVLKAGSSPDLALVVKQ